MQPLKKLIEDNSLDLVPGPLWPDAHFKKILVLDDDDFSQKMFDKIITDCFMDFKPVVAKNANEARQALFNNNDIQLAILDIFLNNQETSIDLYRQCIKKSDWQTPVLLTSAISELEMLKLIGKDTPAPLFIKKPFTPSHCAKLIQTIIQRRLNSAAEPDID